MLLIVTEQLYGAETDKTTSSADPVAPNSLVPCAKVPVKALACVFTGQPMVVPPAQAIVLHAVVPLPRSWAGMHDSTPSMADFIAPRNCVLVMACIQHGSNPLWATRSPADAVAVATAVA